MLSSAAQVGNVVGQEQGDGQDGDYDEKEIVERKDHSSTWVLARRAEKCFETLPALLSRS
jgi:hypothetical protein